MKKILQAKKMKKFTGIVFIVAISLNIYGQDTKREKHARPIANKDQKLNPYDHSEIRIDEPIDGNLNLANSQQVYTNVETFPQFKGGWENFYQFVNDNLVYPKEMKDNNIQGRVIVEFIVEPDSSLSYLRLVKPFGHGADEEVLRIMALSPKWLPGLMGGKSVRTLMTVPINLKLPIEKQKIDTEYIKYLKDAGFNNIGLGDAITLKKLDLDSSYIESIKSLGYSGLTVNQLIGLKTQNVTINYIKGINKIATNKGLEKLNLSELASFKMAGIDSAYFANIASTSFKIKNPVDIRSLKAGNVSPDFIKQFDSAGIKDLPERELIALNGLNITPQYISQFESMGYSPKDIEKIVPLKVYGITPEFVKSFETVGFKHISTNSLRTVADAKLTPVDVQQYEALGYHALDISKEEYDKNQLNKKRSDIIADNRNLTIAQIATFKLRKISPDYIKGFQDIGYKDINPYTFGTLRGLNITPDLVKSFWTLGFNNIPYSDLVYLKTPLEYVKGLQKIGYKNITLKELASLYRKEITVEFIKGFNKLGFDNIPISQLLFVESVEITPDFVEAMQLKGYKSKDLQKYQRLKFGDFTPWAEEKEGANKKP